MSISKDLLQGLNSDNVLDISGRSLVTFQSLNATSGLQSDIENMDKQLRLELEFDLSEIENVKAEIEIELKVAKIVSASIESDKEAIAKEAVNRDVLDYSIKSFNNQMQSNNRNDLRIETIESEGMQGLIGSMVGGSISSGFKYIIDNKKEILAKAWEKLKALYKALIKKIKEYYRKGFYTLYKLVAMPTKILERLSGLPAGQLITEDIISEATRKALYNGFALFAILNTKSGNSWTFDFTNDIDRLRLEQAFSTKMFLDIATAAKDGVLKNRDVDLLKILADKDLIKDAFNFIVPDGYSFEKSLLIPIALNGKDAGYKYPNVSYAIVNSDFYTQDSFDLTHSSVGFAEAILKLNMTENINIKLGTVGDLSRIANVLINFDANILKNIEDSQSKGLSMLEKKVDSFNVDDKDMQDKFKVYKNIYDMLNVMSIKNLLGMVTTYSKAIQPLEMIATEILEYNNRNNAGTQSDIGKLEAGLQFFGFGSKYESRLAYTKLSEYYKGSGYAEAAWETLGTEVWKERDLDEVRKFMDIVEQNYANGSKKLPNARKVSPDKVIVDDKKYKNYTEELEEIYNLNAKGIEELYVDEYKYFKDKAVSLNKDFYKLITKIHKTLRDNITPIKEDK